MNNLHHHKAVLMALETIQAMFRRAPHTQTWTSLQVSQGEMLTALAKERIETGQEIMPILTQLRQLASSLQPPESAVVAASLEALTNWCEGNRA